jgi:gamma-glutamyltranspeptidase/glutathione hydrolase/leukotriene-C4 hydrolase
MESSSERAPLLSPNQRRNRRSTDTTFARLEDLADEHGLPKLLVRIFAVLLVLATLGVAIAIVVQEYSYRQDPHYGSGRPYKPKLAIGRSGGVAAEEERCSNIGVKILQAKGNAVDAAIAATLCTGVVNMFSSGIGGGGFMIVRVPASCTKKERAKGMKYCSKKTTIDFRETAPAAAYTTMYEGRPNAARWGGLAVGVPGELKGLEEAHRRWGRLSWSKLVEPSIKLAEATYVSRELDSRLQRFGSLIIADPDWQEIFLNADRGTMIRRGDVIRRKALAKTLAKVAKDGADAFYYGEVAQALVDKAKSKDGIITTQDFANYTVEVRDVVQAEWGDKRVFTTPAPTSGPVLLSMLQVTDGFADWVKNGARSGLNVHRMVEAMKFSSSQRTRIGDPAFLNEKALKVIDHISTKKEANRVRKRIDDDRTHEIDYYDPLYDIQDSHGTMHLSVVDEEGMAVALTSTVNLPFGSAVLDPVTGVILNDEMDDSSTPGVPNAFGLFPSPYNYPEPNKRPLSSTAPTIVEEMDGRLYVALGGAGGSRIYGSVAQVLFNLQYGMDLSASIERPRFHHQLLPASVSVESTADESLVDALRQRGHQITTVEIDQAVAEVQAVQVGHGPGKLRKVFAASDSRKGGVAAAY